MAFARELCRPPRGALYTGLTVGEVAALQPAPFAAEPETPPPLVIPGGLYWPGGGGG
jgi:hypothetical protein